MAGFPTTDSVVNAVTLGQKWDADWTKNMLPTTVAIANECSFLARGAGNPPADAIFNVGSTLVFQPVTDTTASGGQLPHGGNVSPMYKFLMSGQAFTAAATVAPCQVALIDLVGFYRKTPITSVAADATTNTLTAFSTFTADAGTDICTHTNINLFPYTRVRLTTTVTLPAGLALATDYYVIKTTDLTCQLATSYANAVAGTAINITGTGTGTHTINTLLPRYTSGAGLNAFIWANNATPLGAATPNMSLGYTNAAQTASRATPTVLPVGKTACPNGQIVYTGASAAGKYNYAMPLQSGDTGIASIDTIQNSISYVSGEYSVAMYKELARFPITTLGVPAERDFIFQLPGGAARIYDGAALYFVLMHGAATPVNSTISGRLSFVWN